MVYDKYKEQLVYDKNNGQWFMTSTMYNWFTTLNGFTIQTKGFIKKYKPYKDSYKMDYYLVLHNKCFSVMIHGYKVLFYKY